jgi:type IV fimbrial biogenesis protein FimT
MLPPLAMSKISFHAGFTLIELMIGLSMVAILATLAAPSFNEVLLRFRADAQARELQSVTLYARTEALKRAKRVVVCRSAAPAAALPVCGGAGSWASGWLMFVDNVGTPGNTVGAMDGADQLLRVGEPYANATVVASGDYANWFGFAPSGRPVSPGFGNGSFQLCQKTKGRQITVTTTGQVGILVNSCV